MWVTHVQETDRKKRTCTRYAVQGDVMTYTKLYITTGK